MSLFVGDSAHCVRGMVNTHERGTGGNKGGGQCVPLPVLVLAALVSLFISTAHHTIPPSDVRSWRNLLLARARSSKHALANENHCPPDPLFPAKSGLEKLTIQKSIVKLRCRIIWFPIRCEKPPNTLTGGNIRIIFAGKKLNKKNKIT